MNFPYQKSIISTVIVALLGLIVFKFALVNVQIDNGVVFLVAALISGFVATFINAPKAESVKTKSLYVGNLPYKANEATVKELFANHGHVVSVRLLKDKNTGKRRGFGFVEVAHNDAEAMIKALNDKEFQQRTLKVREAKVKQEQFDQDGVTGDSINQPN
jgi:hypothetical protein